VSFRGAQLAIRAVWHVLALQHDAGTGLSADPGQVVISGVASGNSPKGQCRVVDGNPLGLDVLRHVLNSTVSRPLTPKHSTTWS
jgi:hypothetical protein